MPRPGFRGPEASFLSDFGVDPSGTPWSVAGGSLARWTGSGWAQVEVRGLRNWSETAHLFGGPDRGLFLAVHLPPNLTQPGDRPHTGSLFLLEDGKPRRVADYYYEDAPHLHVTAGGRVCCWAERYLAALEDGVWRSLETPLGRDEVSVVALGPDGPIVFVPPDRGTVALAAGSVLREGVRRPPVPGEVETERKSIRACGLGKDSVLLWSRTGATVAGLVDDGLYVLEEAAARLRAGLGSGVEILGGARDGRGDAWLLVRGRRGKGNRVPTLARVSADGTVSFPAVPAETATALGQDLFREPEGENLLAARDGTVWIGLPQDGILRIRGDRADRFDWRAGVLAPEIRWLAEAPDGTVWAASGRGDVYRWDPAAPPGEGPEARWSCVPVLGNPLRAPDGRLLVVRRDRPGRIGSWDGQSWTETPLPREEGGAEVRCVVFADDRGGVGLSQHPEGSRVLVLAEGGSSVHAGIEEALAARLAAGARRFATRARAKVLVDGKGKAWLCRNEWDRLRGFFEWRWEECAVRGVRDMALLEEGDPAFATNEGWWVYRGGRFDAVTGREEFPGLSLLPPDGDSGVPFWTGLPEQAREGRTPLWQGEPLPWEAALRIAREGPVRAAGGLPPVRPRGEGPPPEVDAGVEAWSLRSRPRGRTGSEGRGTPLQGRLGDLEWAAFDRADRLCATLRRPTGDLDRALFLDRAGGPRLRGVAAEVERGRTVRLRRAGDADALWMEVREGLDGAWTACAGPEGDLWRPAVPRKGRTSLWVRGVDALGLRGSPVPAEPDLDARFPALSWEGGVAPRDVTEPRWRVPIRAAWAFEDVPRRIEWRADGGEWRPLPEDGVLPVGALNNRSVAFEFRAVEEDAFAGPVLAARIAVEMDPAKAGPVPGDVRVPPR